jgi:glycosyltransferase involved in cell wall biosynthesis
MKLNFFAQIYGDIGYAIHARNFAIGMEEVGIEVTVIPSERYQGRPMDKRIEEMMKRQPNIKNPSIRLSYGNDFASFSGTPRIGYTYFETDKLFDDWVNQMSQVDMLFASSNWHKQIMKKHGLKNIEVVPLGVDTTIFNPYNLPFKELQNDTFKILTVGKWEVRKGFDLLLKAVSDEFTKKENVEVLMMTHNPFIPNYNPALAVLGLGLEKYPKMQFLNQMNIDMLSRLYCSVDCFCLPTRGEGWGLPIIESMASGCPTIATYNTSMKDYMKKEYNWLVGTDGLEEVKNTFFPFP